MVKLNKFTSSKKNFYYETNVYDYKDKSDMNFVDNNEF